MSRELEAVSAGLFQGLLRRAHLCRPDDLADAVAEEARAALGATDVVLYLVNYEQTALVPVPGRRCPAREPQPIDGALGGRAFASSTTLASPAGVPGRSRMWVPVLDGTVRMGVLELTVDATNATNATKATEPAEVAGELVELVERYGHAVAQAVLSKSQYGDVFELVQRSQQMTVGAELLWSVLPPPTYATDGLAISAMLEPAYRNGGDAFDYAVNGDGAHLAVFDGMGHGLEAAGVSTFAVAAYRHSRRLGLGLVETYAAMDAAVTAQFDGSRFVTAVLARLDLGRGRLQWVSAGHPPPLLIRRGKVVKLLEVDPATPLGVTSADVAVTVAEEDLEPGDSVLLYTDGLTEARHPGGGPLNEHGLADFVQREAAAQRPTPETLRRLRQMVLAHQGGVLRDDATALLVDWCGGAEDRLVPRSVT